MEINKEEIKVKVEEVFEKSKDKAKEILENKDKLDELVKKSTLKIKESPLMDGLNEVPTLVDMIKAYANGEYREIPFGSIIAIIIAVAYWVSPVDIIPDYVPGVGYIDDAAVVIFCLNFIKTDFDNFKKWKVEKASDSNVIDVEVNK